MVSFDDLKVSLSTYIMRNRRVTYQDLLKWSSGNKVGNALLYLLIRELIREKRFRASGEYVIGVLKVGNNEVKLSIPMYVEVPGESVKQSIQVKRQVRQRRVRSSSILEAFSEERNAEAKQTAVESGEVERREARATTVEIRQEGQKKQELGAVGHEEVESVHESGRTETSTKEGREEPTSSLGIENAAIPTDYSTVTMEDFTAMLRRLLRRNCRRIGRRVIRLLWQCSVTYRGIGALVS
ncbi:hypothetical protein [Vulcanisaeta sp. JCM 16161]|uniref:hypothetical protein n=1 Tax=Vulcanisaeta sp. JCM 16161 TaxID=1295372 RepID=UPI000B03D7AD|nr:hypothetical protein [Vulcanisaeta sp. JCM 16161]